MPIDPTTLVLPPSTGRGLDAIFAIGLAQQAFTALLAGDLDHAQQLLADATQAAANAGADQVDGDDRLNPDLLAATKDVAGRAAELLTNLTAAHETLAAAAEKAAQPAPEPTPLTGG